MSITCSICQDFLTERPQSLTPNDELVICTLRCGHLFHYVCVQQWFRSTASRTRARAPEAQEGSCPCCKTVASLATAIRVFPTGDEDSNSIVQQKKTLDAVMIEKEKLTTDLQDANQLLQRISTDLEEEIVAHDMLKMEYAQSLSKNEALQEQINDMMSMKEALENSLKTELEKLKKEKADALRTIAVMESREKNLISEMELLRVSDEEQTLKNPIENTSTQAKRKSNSRRVINSDSDETSDGESPSVSPSSSQNNQRIMLRIPK